MISATFFLGLLMVVGSTALRQPAWVLNYIAPSALLSFFFLALAFIPSNRFRLGKKESALPFPKYVALLCLGQLAFCLITVAVALAFVGSTSLQGLKAFFTLQALPFWLKQPYLSSWLLFPWSLFGLWALMIAFVAYQKEAYPLIANVVRLFCYSRFEPYIKNYIEYILSASTLLCLSFSIGGALLLISNFFSTQLGLSSHIENDVIKVILLSCIYPLFFMVLNHKRFLAFTKKHALFKIPFMLTGLMVPVLVISDFLAKGALQHIPHKIALLQLSCMQYVEALSTQNRLTGLFLGWCLLWIPTAGSFIAYYSKGRTLREVVIGVACFPIILFLACYCFITEPFLLKAIAAPAFHFILSILVLCFITAMMWNMKNNLFLYAGFMPLPNPPKRNRMDFQWAPKLLGVQKCFMMITMAVLSTLLIHRVGGWVIIAFQILTIAAYTIFILYSAVIGLSIYYLAHKKLFFRFVTRLIRA